MTVRELLARIDSAELAEWIAYEQLAGPLDVGSRVDINAAMIAATVVNVQRGKGKAPRKIDDFLIKWDHRGGKRVQSPEEMLAVVRALNRRMGGTDPRPPIRGRDLDRR